MRTTATLTLSLLTVGCTEPTPTTTPPPAAVADEHDEQSHAHPTEGPHHGQLIELGNEEYHAELVHDHDTETLMIYVLDVAATAPVAIDAEEVTINVTHDGQPQQFTLAASPDEGDAEGKSSRFVSSDKELAEHLEDEHPNAQLVLMIAGRSYRGSIPHGHGHHDHAHE